MRPDQPIGRDEELAIVRAARRERHEQLERNLREIYRRRDARAGADECEDLRQQVKRLQTENELLRLENEALKREVGKNEGLKARQSFQA